MSSLPDGDRARALSAGDKALLRDFQRDFPLEPRPFATVGRKVGLREADVIAALQAFSRQGVVSRVGATIVPHTVGWSTLAAMAVPEERLEGVAELVCRHPEVNHCYEREHELNLWFVVAGTSERRCRTVLDEIEKEAALPVVILPLIEAFRVDLGFPIQWT